MPSARRATYERCPASWRSSGAAAAGTLYLGGGTPSLLAPERLSRLIEAVCERFSLSPDAEITLEANPHDLSAAGFLPVRSASANRLSLGTQAFNVLLSNEVFGALV